GEVSARMFYWIVMNKARILRAYPELELRALAIIDSYLALSQGKPVSAATLTAIWLALGKICPSNNALSLIRRWTVVNPHGHEIMDTMLVELLEYWPLSEAGPLVLEVLETHSAGAIKGVVTAWSATKNKWLRVKWTESEAKQLLEVPLAEAIMKTDSSAAVFYARNFASEDLLKPQALRISKALLGRTDSAYVSSQGFGFLSIVDPAAAAEAKWLEWFESDDDYKILAACTSAVSFPNVSAKPDALDRLFALATNPEHIGEIEAVAGQALVQLDADNSRSMDILEYWLDQPNLEDAALHAAARIALWAPFKLVKPVLLNAINDPAASAQSRRAPMLLLAITSPGAALSFCEDKKTSSWFTDETMLLVAAAAEAMNPSSYWLNAKNLRKKIFTPEPQWMKNIRFQLEAQTKTMEEVIVSYASSRPK
ncbi:MAG: hypothetical protein V3V10_08070, partial [Planctomycetota bacterium]